MDVEREANGSSAVQLHPGPNPVPVHGGGYSSQKGIYHGAMDENMETWGATLGNGREGKFERYQSKQNN